MTQLNNTHWLESVLFLGAEEIDQVECVSHQVAALIARSRKQVACRFIDIKFFIPDYVRECCQYRENRGSEPCEPCEARKRGCSMHKYMEHRHFSDDKIENYKSWLAAPCFDRCMKEYKELYPRLPQFRAPIQPCVPNKPMMKISEVKFSFFSARTMPNIRTHYSMYELGNRKDFSCQLTVTPFLCLEHTSCGTYATPGLVWVDEALTSKLAPLATKTSTLEVAIHYTQAYTEDGSISEWMRTLVNGQLMRVEGRCSLFVKLGRSDMQGEQYFCNFCLLNDYIAKLLTTDTPSWKRIRISSNESTKISTGEWNWEHCHHIIINQRIGTAYQFHRRHNNINAWVIASDDKKSIEWQLAESIWDKHFRAEPLHHRNCPNR